MPASYFYVAFKLTNPFLVYMHSGLKTFLPFVFTLGATAFGFLLNQTWQKSKDKKERLQKIITLLGAAENELSFYIRKLNELVTSLEYNFMKQEADITGVAVPSFNFSPAFLEKARINLMEYHETAAVIGIVGECHFELGHVQAKLDNYKMLGEKVRAAGGDNTSITVMKINSDGLQGLAKRNTDLFTEARIKVASTKKEVSQMLDDFYENNLFGSILRE